MQQLIEKIRIDHAEILKEGLPYFKYIREVNGLFRLSRRLKGCHRPDVVQREIKRRKIEELVEYAKDLGAVSIRRSMTTNSVYFYLHDKQYRISDHRRSDFDGISIDIKWNSDIEQIKQIIINIKS